MAKNELTIDFSKIVSDTVLVLKVTGVKRQTFRFRVCVSIIVFAVWVGGFGRIEFQMDEE